MPSEPKPLTASEREEIQRVKMVDNFSIRPSEELRRYEATVKQAEQERDEQEDESQANEQRLKECKARVRELEAALRGLIGETKGMIEVGGQELIHILSVTNVRCLQRRVAEAERLLSGEGAK